MRQPLNFTVTVAKTVEEMNAACKVRAQSYGHHLGGDLSAWEKPDELDMHPSTAVFIATCKDTGQHLGTVRLSTNEARPTQIERSAEIPHEISSGLMAEVTRLAVPPGQSNPAVKLALLKATYLWCVAKQAKWMVIGARSDALIRQYKRLGFTFLKEDAVPLAHAGGMLHKILAFNVSEAERNWHAMKHPFYTFMVRFYHPDIRVI